MVETGIICCVYVRHVLRMIDSVVGTVVAFRADPDTDLYLITKFNVLAPEAAPVTDSI